MVSVCCRAERVALATWETENIVMILRHQEILHDVNRRPHSPAKMANLKGTHVEICFILKVVSQLKSHNHILLKTDFKQK